MHPEYSQVSVNDTDTNSSHSDESSKVKSVKAWWHYVLLTFALISLGFGSFSILSFIRLSEKHEAVHKRIISADNLIAITRNEPRFCVSCNEINQISLQENALNLLQLSAQKEDDEKICCAKSATQMSNLLNLYATRQEMLRCSQGILHNATGVIKTIQSSDYVPLKRDTNISAFLQAGIQNGTGTDFVKQQPIKQWLLEKPGTHLNGINITDGRLVVPQTGIYFLYSQVGFLLRYDKVYTEKTSQSIFHTVHRWNMKYPLGNQELLRSAITQCWNKNREYARYTSYAGASVELNKGDQIYVTVSRLHDLSRDSTHTYLGLFAIN